MAIGSGRYGKKDKLKRKGVFLDTSPYAKYTEGIRLITTHKKLPVQTNFSKRIECLTQFNPALQIHV